MVLPLDFSNLDTTDYAHFEQDFNAKNNIKLNEFLVKYKQELGDISLVNEKIDFVANLLKICGRVALRALKVVLFYFILTLSFRCM